jgi:hypothetical protein
MSPGGIGVRGLECNRKTSMSAEDGVLSAEWRIRHSCLSMVTQFLVLIAQSFAYFYDHMFGLFGPE